MSNENQIANTKALNNYIKELYDLWLIDGNEISDTIHTFGELYDYRMMYNALFVNEIAENGKYEVYKTKKHNDGQECFGGGWFLVSVRLPTGVVDNHYENKYWDLFHCPEVEKKPYPYDGHTPADALENGKKLARDYAHHRLTVIERDILEVRLSEIKKKRVISIEKTRAMWGTITLAVWIELEEPNEDGDTKDILTIGDFDEFKEDEDFKGMLMNREYTPEELDLDV